MTSPPPTADELRAAFDAPTPFTVGVEEELMLLDPETHDLIPRAQEALAAVESDERYKLELPAAQLEIRLPPLPSVGDVAAALRAARGDLAAATAPFARLGAAGVHPFAATAGELNRGGRYDRARREYGAMAQRQLVFALQAHVAVGDADRTLAVYNALRSYLPELAALAANAPFYAGCDTGFASVRPKVAELLPRQGVPPRIASWEEYADALRWGATSGAFPTARFWWWELRPHPDFGTLELRVPDAQSTVAEAAAIVAVAQALVAWLAGRHKAGEELSVAPSWRIAENRWWAARDGLDGRLADLDSGERAPTRERMAGLLDSLTPVAERLGCAGEIQAARRLARENGAQRQRAAAARTGVESLGRWLAERYLADDPV
jgi:carboxylate-amine ligase